MGFKIHLAHFINWKCQAYVCTPYFSWHKVLIWRLKNYWFLNFNFVLLIMKIGQLLKSCYHDPVGHLYPCNSHVLGNRLSQHPETILIILKSLININHVKVFIPTYFVFSSCIILTKSCWLKGLEICAEDLYIRADFLYEIRL